MPSLKADLDGLIRIPSIAAPGFSRAPLIEAHDLVADLLRRAGVAQVETLGLPDAPPIVIGDISAPDCGPTVLLYSHYDVVPPGDERGWTSGPFEPTEWHGAIYGRGAADSKANVIAHIGALRAWEGRPPVGIRIVIDGQAELDGGALPRHCRSHPDLFRVDAMLIADTGNPRPGVPALTVAVPGFVAETSGPAYEAAVAAMSEAWGQAPRLVPSGDSIPLAGALHRAVPEAEILMFGATDGQSNSHGPNERVLIDEFEKTVVAETKFFREFAARAGSRS
jgi:acetylornithine deacetylase/succinyl-diaminopimelate desuccinylase-like protein